MLPQATSQAQGFPSMIAETRRCKTLDGKEPRVRNPCYKKKNKTHKHKKPQTTGCRSCSSAKNLWGGLWGGIGITVSSSASFCCGLSKSEGKHLVMQVILKALYSQDRASAISGKPAPSPDSRNQRGETCCWALRAEPKHSKAGLSR